MIKLLHGDNIEASRNRLNQIRQENKDKEALLFNGKNITPTDLVQALESNSLFGSERIIIIESFFTNKRYKEEGFKSILKRVAPENGKRDIVFWEGVILTPSQLKLLPKLSKIELFKEPAVIFQFVDNLRPGNTKILLKLLKEGLKQKEPELVFGMIVRQFRLLLLAKDNVNEGEDMGRLAPWQKSKLKAQSRSFSSDKLISIYQKLLDIDISIKTGKSALPLNALLDLFVIKSLS